MGLESDIQKISELSAQSSSAQSEAHEKFRQLQEKIKNGESTGDSIKDFVIVNLGTLSSDTEKPYRETEARIKQNIGSQILVVEQREDIHGCPGIIPPEYIESIFFGVDTTLKLGILASGLKLDIGKGVITFPTEKYARKYNDRKWELNEGPISLSWFEFMNLGKEVQRRNTRARNDSSLRFGHGLALHLGKEVEEFFESVAYIDTSYVRALNLLGLEAPERFRKRYDKETHQKRLGIINHLEELTRKESRLVDEINSIYGSAKHGGFMGGGAVTIVEDEDDAKVVSMGPRMRLKETREEIQRYLKDAIELGMHKGQLKIEQKPGLEVNVPAYISGMCEKYKVEIAR